MSTLTPKQIIGILLRQRQRNVEPICPMCLRGNITVSWKGDIPKIGRHKRGNGSWCESSKLRFDTRTTERK